ncbi:hypothetical protein [Clostridium botulinum]|uniref:hypothetical protein n=1 Tax=Clostridium botulinum TaxID=1491 RepID=UPI0007745EF8|nr:hypothetical protein [Clostridium botulinum]MBY6931036.1 hypothetical protein [Clostridium botulinum]NFG19941.1 hypothetical protein [Clostridium botulinum]NFO82243.1 hypothetical protein [Clostridium botulinum]
MSEKLVATYPILFESHQYKIGEELPASNHDMVKTWLDAGTAKWYDNEQLVEDIDNNNSDNQENINDELENVAINEEVKMIQENEDETIPIKNKIGRKNK